MPERPFKLGWIPDLPDHRDLMYSASRETLQALPPRVDLRPQFPGPPYDQGQIGSCTANAIAGAIQFERAKAKQQPPFTPSRLFIYYNERAMEHTLPLDNGAQIRDGIKSVHKTGVCTEGTWRYDDTPADPDTHLFPQGSPPVTKPSPQAYAEAAKYKALSYFRIANSLRQMKGCLADGYPFVFGFSVYSSLWDSSGNPVVDLPMPAPADASEGGHAVLAVGYDDAKSLFIIRNSWGPSVQDAGYFYMPYAYLTDDDLSNDFWTIRAMTA
ncbi:MAG TPA: C1 family peptidase [Vicinamibacteria bacterium]|nr:C1 family peptidase [Vicinamibacteria bacterium]